MFHQVDGRKEPSYSWAVVVVASSIPPSSIIVPSYLCLVEVGMLGARSLATRYVQYLSILPLLFPSKISSSTTGPSSLTSNGSHTIAATEQSGFTRKPDRPVTDHGISEFPSRRQWRFMPPTHTIDDGASHILFFCGLVRRPDCTSEA